MSYHIVDSYYRQQHFDFFAGYQTPFYSLTFDLDIARLKARTDLRAHPIYLSLCWAFTSAMQTIEDFRYRVIDGRIVLYDQLDIAATLPAPDGLFTFGFFEYHTKLEEFLSRAEATDLAARTKADLAQPEDCNHLLFTALPKVPFTGFSHAKGAENTDARPRIAFGKFRPDGENLWMPVGLEVNHIFIDGNAVGALYENAQAAMNDTRK